MVEHATFALWESRFLTFLTRPGEKRDAAHDPGHVRRVVSNALTLAKLENARADIVFAAAWLHDCIHVPKNSSARSRASRLCAEAARDLLAREGWPAQDLDAVYHAVEAHSFSAGIPPTTLEAKVVQDADRLDALGALGLSRCLMLGGEMGSRLFHPEDPWAENRPLDDARWSVDHFLAKLLRLPATMQTQSGREEALRRVALLHQFLEELGREIGKPYPQSPTGV